MVGPRTEILAQEKPQMVASRSKQIDEWINDNRGMKSASTICFMDFARDDEIVSSDRKTQAEIDRDLSAYPNSFFAVVRTRTNLEIFWFRVGIF